MTWLGDLYKRGSVSEVWKYESGTNVFWGLVAVCLWEILVTISHLELLVEWIIEFSYALLGLMRGEKELFWKLWADVGEGLWALTANVLRVAWLFLEEVYARGSVVGFGSAFLIYYLWKSFGNNPKVNLESTVPETEEEAGLINAEADRSPGWKIRLHRLASDRITYVFPGWFSRSLNRTLEMILAHGTRDQAAALACLVLINAIHWKVGAVEHHIPKANRMSMVREAFIGLLNLMGDVGWLWFVFVIVIGFTNYCGWTRKNIGAAVATILIAYFAQLPWAISLRHTGLGKYVLFSDKRNSKSRLVFNIISVLIGWAFAYSVMWTMENFFGESTSSSTTEVTIRADDTTTITTSGGPNPEGATGKTLANTSPETALITADGMVNLEPGTGEPRPTNGAEPRVGPRNNSFLTISFFKSCCGNLGWFVAVLAVGYILYITFPSPSSPGGEISRPVFLSRSEEGHEDSRVVYENSRVTDEGGKSTDNPEVKITVPQEELIGYSEQIFQPTETKTKPKTKQPSTTTSKKDSKGAPTHTLTSPSWRGVDGSIPIPAPSKSTKKSKSPQNSPRPSSKTPKKPKNPNDTKKPATSLSQSTKKPTSPQDPPRLSSKSGKTPKTPKRPKDTKSPVTPPFQSTEKPKMSITSENSPTPSSDSTKKHKATDQATEIQSETSSKSAKGSKHAPPPSSTPDTTPIYDNPSPTYGWNSGYYADGKSTRVHDGVYSKPSPTSPSWENDYRPDAKTTRKDDNFYSDTTKECQNALCRVIVRTVDLTSGFIRYLRSLNPNTEVRRMMPIVWSALKNWDFSLDTGNFLGDCVQSLSIAALTFAVILALWWLDIVSIVYKSPLGFLVDIACSVPVLWLFWWKVGWEKVGSSLQGDSSWKLCLSLFVLKVAKTVISQATYRFFNAPSVHYGTIIRPSALLTVIVPVTTRVKPSFRPNMERMLRSGAFRIYIISNSLETWNSVQQALKDVGNVGNWHNYNYHGRNPAVTSGELPSPPATPQQNAPTPAAQTPAAPTPATLIQCITYGLYLRNDVAPQRTFITAVSMQDAVWNDDFLPSALSYFEDRSVNFLGVSCAGVRVRHHEENGKLRFKESWGNFLQCMEMDRKTVECVSANRIDGCIPQLASSVWFFQTASLFQHIFITEGQLVKDEEFPNWMGEYLIQSGYKLRWYNPNEEQRRIREHQEVQGWRQYASAIGQASLRNWNHRLSMVLNRKVWRHHPWTLFSCCFFPLLDKTPILFFFFLACQGFYDSSWRFSREVFDGNSPTISGCALLTLWLIDGGITRGGFKACKTAWQLGFQARLEARKNTVALQNAQMELEQATTALTNARNERDAGLARLRPLRVAAQQLNVTKAQKEAFTTENETQNRVGAELAAAQGKFDAAVLAHEAAQEAAGTIGARFLGIPARVWRLVGWELCFGFFAVVFWPLFASWYETLGLLLVIWRWYCTIWALVFSSIVDFLAIAARWVFPWAPTIKASLLRKWMSLNDRVMALFREDAGTATATATATAAA